MNKKYKKFNLENRPWDWWLRSAYSDGCYGVGYIYFHGRVRSYIADYDYGMLLACFEI